MLTNIVMPILLAMLISLLLEAPVARLTVLYGSRRLAATVVFGGALAGLLLAMGIVVSHLFAEAEHLLEYLARPGSGALSDMLPPGLPFSSTTLAEYGVEFLAALTELLRATPELLLSLLVTLLAAYYLLVEPDLPLKALCAVAPNRLHGRIRQVYGQALTAFAAYLRAQAVVILQTFALSLVGLRVLGVDFVLLFAVLIALLDLLPMIGPGTLLLPWAVLAAWQGDGRLALGLAVLLLVIIIGRQVVEPKIMGAGLGLHPLAALLAGFVGLAVFGAFGLLLGPVLVSLLYFVYLEKENDGI